MLIGKTLGLEEMQSRMRGGAPSEVLCVTATMVFLHRFCVFIFQFLHDD